MQITHRIVLETHNCGHDAVTISSDSPLVCQMGCSGNIGGTTFNCTDSMPGGIESILRGTYIWSAGEGTYTYNIGGTEPYFEAT